ncbi:RING finger protein [Moelleriella libera RCEF 2490]|uniref:RBR-type E3 ubiquitin transferase n=1 Tax=Moelleriella libera RCEF 2490 TaxID=1081109 RepID=A0A168CEQ9_9HYPO|nr:RING finger protein [Moelleriella libera RCEF 2490]
MDDADMEADPRFMELETLEAIYPEIKRLHGTAPDAKFSFELDVPVEPAQPVKIIFPAANTATSDSFANSERPQNGGPEEPLDSLLVSHLPPLHLNFTLPDGYPTKCPPQVFLSTTTQWLPSATLRALEDDGSRLWEETGQDIVAFTYVDHLQREAEKLFGTMGTEGTLEVNPDHKLALLDFDIEARRAVFEKGTFECGVCLEPKKGLKCHKMLDCGHIFCLQCLQDFYNDAIKDGNLPAIRCLSPGCAKDRASKPASKRKRKAVINPSELLQMGLSESMVKRYVTLKYKTELEADKDTVYCPRVWCNGAARSTRHRKPEGLNFADDSGDELDAQADDAKDHETDTGESPPKPEKFDPADLLCVCEDCGFAFCSRCLQTWHGEFVRCFSKRDKSELTEEETASLEYLRLHTSLCPTCSAPAQKTHGCNHMICSRCDTHFCYLCSSWLDPANPYKHYNKQGNGKVTSCYMRLWELEGGDGDDVGLGFRGGGGGLPPIHAAGAAVAAPQAAPQAVGPEDMLHFYEAEDPIEPWGVNSDVDSDDDGLDNEDLVDEAPQRPLRANGDPVDVAREAPLVLRLLDNQPPRRLPAAPPPPPPPARGNRRAQHHQRQPPRGRGAALAMLEAEEGIMALEAIVPGDSSPRSPEGDGAGNLDVAAYQDATRLNIKDSRSFSGFSPRKLTRQVVR